jgi:hypothetical protein
MSLSPPTEPSIRERPSRAPVRGASDDAVRALAASIHRELRESLTPEQIVAVATELLGRCADDLRERRPPSTSEGPTRAGR